MITYGVPTNLPQLFSRRHLNNKNEMNFQQIYSNVYDVSSVIIFLLNENIIHKTRTCNTK